MEPLSTLDVAIWLSACMSVGSNYLLIKLFV